MGESPSLGCPVRSVFVPLPNKTQRCFFFLVHTHSFVSIPVTLLNIPVPFPTKTCSFFAQRCLRLNNPPHLQTYPNRSYELCLHVFILTSQYQNHHEALPRPPPNIPLRRTRTSRRSTRVPPKRSQHSRQPDRLLLPLCDEATDVQKAINSLCTSTNKSAAQSAFIATCSSAGSSVAPYTATSAATTTTPSGSFVYTTVVDGSTIVTSAGTSPTSGAGASATNSAGESAASATGNAASEQRQVGSFAAAVIAIAGVVAVL